MSPLAATEAVAKDDKATPSDQRALLQDVLDNKGRHRHRHRGARSHRAGTVG